MIGGRGAAFIACCLLVSAILEIETALQDALDFLGAAYRDYGGVMGSMRLWGETKKVEEGLG